MEPAEAAFTISFGIEPYTHRHTSTHAITLERDIYYDFPDFIHYDAINKDTILVVDEGVTLTIGKKGLQMDGILQIRGGTVDLENSDGILYGSGKIDLLAGRMIKKSYSVNKNNTPDISCFPTSYSLASVEKVNSPATFSPVTGLTYIKSG